MALAPVLCLVLISVHICVVFTQTGPGLAPGDPVHPVNSPHTLRLQTPSNHPFLSSGPGPCNRLLCLQLHVAPLPVARAFLQAS